MFPETLVARLAVGVVARRPLGRIASLALALAQRLWPPSPEQPSPAGQLSRPLGAVAGSATGAACIGSDGWDTIGNRWGRFAVARFGLAGCAVAGCAVGVCAVAGCAVAGFAAAGFTVGDFFVAVTLASLACSAANCRLLIGRRDWTGRASFARRQPKQR